MDKIPFREEDIVALESIAPDVIGLRTLIVNVYAIFRSRSQWMLIDTGLPHCESCIRKWTDNNFGVSSRPSSILLTHGHFDHTGAVQELAAKWDVPVYVHPLELPYVTGKSGYPPPDPSVGGGLMALLANLYPRGPIDLGSRVQTLPADGSIPGFPDWRWIHTPGHTPGHISLFCEEEAVLIAGDAFATTKQESFLAAATQKAELHGPPAYFTTDWDAARDSVVKLARLRPTTIAAGHGRPLAGDDVPDLLTALANNFDRVARPEHGRYVDQPAA